MAEPNKDGEKAWSAARCYRSIAAKLPPANDLCDRAAKADYIFAMIRASDVVQTLIGEEDCRVIVTDPTYAAIGGTTPVPLHVERSVTSEDLAERRRALVAFAARELSDAEVAHFKAHPHHAAPEARAMADKFKTLADAKRAADANAAREAAPEPPADPDDDEDPSI